MSSLPQINPISSFSLAKWNRSFYLNFSEGKVNALSFKLRDFFYLGSKLSNGVFAFFPFFPFLCLNSKVNQDGKAYYDFKPKLLTDDIKQAQYFYQFRWVLFECATKALTYGSVRSIIHIIEITP